MELENLTPYIEYEKEEYWGYWTRCSCGGTTPYYGKYCCECGKKFDDNLHQETREEYVKRIYKD